MGTARQYNPSGGFYNHEYHQEGDTISYDRLKGKIVVKNEENKNGLPPYSGTSDFYAGKRTRTGEIIQVRFYKDRRQHIDFDWGHEHTNKTGDRARFPAGTVHVQIYENGVRSEIARFMNNDEINRFGALLKSLNQDVKFRP